METSKLVATTGSSDFGFSHKTSPNMQNTVSAKQPRKNSPTTETEAQEFRLSGKFCKAEEFKESLLTTSFKHGDNQQRNNECYLRKWLKFSGSRGMDSLQSFINVATEFLYDLYKSGVQ